MSHAANTDVLFEQDTNDVFLVKMPLAVLQATGGDLSIEKDKLTEIVIDDLKVRAAEAEAEVAICRGSIVTLRGEVATLTTELSTSRARLAGQERLLARLGGESAEASSVALQAKQEALDALSAQLVEQQDLVAELERKLIAADQEVRAFGDAAGRAADANARLIHSEDSRKRLESELGEAVSTIAELRAKVEALATENGRLTREWKQASDGLARADVAKKNALEAQAAQFAEQSRQMSVVADGMSVVSKSELAELRRLAKRVPDLEAALGRAETKADKLNGVMGSYRAKINELEQANASREATEERAADLLKEMHGRCMANKLDLDYALMALRMFNNQPEYKSDSGRLTIMALDSGALQSADSHTIHPNTPLCWWNTKGGLGCVTMLSAEPADDGEHYLIFPSFSATIPGVEGVVDVAKAVMPPEEEWPAIIEHMKALDSAKMKKAMDEGDLAAKRYSHLVNPDALPVITEAERARHRRTVIAAKKTVSATKSSSKRKGRK